MIRTFFLLSLLLAPQFSHSKGISNDLMAFFKKAGLTSNVTTPRSYQDQTAGFYTGGSLVTRNSVRNAQIAVTTKVASFLATFPKKASKFFKKYL